MTKKLDDNEKERFRKEFREKFRERIKKKFRERIAKGEVMEFT
jgi:hypothetical protein